MMLRAKLSYSTRDLLKTMTPEQLVEFGALWPGEKISSLGPDHFYDHSTQRITIEEGLALEALGVKLEIEGLDGVMLTKMKDTSRWSSWPRNDPQVQDLMNGSLVQVTIPDMALLRIQHVTWIEDACTEELQRYLDKQWRILAVCPPNAARRPDYILGWMGAGEPQHP